MAALTQDTDYFVKQMVPSQNFTMILVQTKNTVDAADTLTVTLANYGISATGLIGVVGFKHTTDNSVMAQEQPTTSVSSGVLTIAVPAGTDDDPRFYLIIGTSSTNP